MKRKKRAQLNFTLILIDRYLSNLIKNRKKNEQMLVRTKRNKDTQELVATHLNLKKERLVNLLSKKEGEVYMSLNKFNTTTP